VSPTALTIPTTNEVDMRKLGLLPILAVALVACADQTGPIAPDGINSDLQPILEAVWFVTDPPDPALVGDTYDAEAGADGTRWENLEVTSLTDYVCSVSTTHSEGHEWHGTVTFVAAGECGLYVSNPYDGAFQIFEVYEPTETPAPIMKTCSKSDHVKKLEIRIPLHRPCPPGWD
jgi:hypothetical protein